MEYEIYATHDDLVLEAVSYFRHVGADLESIGPYVMVRAEVPHKSSDDLKSLKRLEEAGKVQRVGKRWFLTPGTYRQAKGSAFAPEFQFEDAWILLVLLYRRESGPSNLVDIIALADGINHAIPTIDELHGALNRLAAARLIQVRRGTFQVTDRALELYSKVEQCCPQRVFDQLEGLEKVLACPCCGPRLKRVRWHIMLTQELLDKAYSAYRKRFRSK